MNGLRVCLVGVAGLVLLATARGNHRSAVMPTYGPPPMPAYPAGYVSPFATFLTPCCAAPMPTPAPTPAPAPMAFVPQSYFPRLSAVCPCQEASGPIACATPAPASPGPTTLPTDEPPLATPNPKQPKGPMIYQNRSFSGVPQQVEPRAVKSKVSFWNLTGDDVIVTVEDRNHTIAKDRAVILELPRSFSWRSGFQAPKTESVPDDVNHFEVMIR